jgi:hypothetical protein
MGEGWGEGLSSEKDQEITFFLIECRVRWTEKIAEISIVVHCNSCRGGEYHRAGFSPSPGVHAWVGEVALIPEPHLWGFR